MAPNDHDHPVNPERVAAARAGVLSVGEAGHLAGLLGMLADPVRSRILFALAAGKSCAWVTWRWPWTSPRTRCPTP